MFFNRKIRPPFPVLTLMEGPRSCFETSTLCMVHPVLKKLPKGDGHPVMVIPGFAGSDTYNYPLIRFLRAQYYNAHGWNRGRNFGQGLLDPEILIKRVQELYQETEQKVSLIGHSLGGVYAREIAKLWPQEVRQVITLGSPFGEGRETASFANKLHEWFSPHHSEQDTSYWHEAPPVPTTAIYSRTDGVINWRISAQRDGHKDTENIEVYSSHNGMTVNPAVWWVINNRLAQLEDYWQPFNRSDYQNQLFPTPCWPAYQKHAVNH